MKRAEQRAMADVIIERDEPVVVPTRRPQRTRLPAPLRVPILIVLNVGIKALLWQAASNFLSPELGYVSKAPTDNDLYTLYSPLARLITKIVSVYITWTRGYDCNYKVNHFQLISANRRSLRCLRAGHSGQRALRVPPVDVLPNHAPDCGRVHEH